MIQTKGKKVADDVSFRTDFAVEFLGTVIVREEGTGNSVQYVNPSNRTKIGKFVVHSAKGDIDYSFKFDPELYETIFLKQNRTMTVGKSYFLDFKIESYRCSDGKDRGLVLNLCDFREGADDGAKHSSLVLSTESSVRKPFFTGGFYDTPKCIAVHFNVRGNFWISVLFRKAYYNDSFKKDLQHFPGTVVDLKCIALVNPAVSQMSVSLMLAKYNVLKLSDFNTESPDNAPVTADDLPI